MRTSILARYAAATIASGMLAACNGGGPQTTPTIPGASQIPNIHHMSGPSWIRPDAAKRWLLYVSNGDTGALDIYDYKTGKLVGQIATGFNYPSGQCVDTKGNVYVTDEDNGAPQISEYARGGSTPIANVVDTYGTPDGCSVDAKTGNVAVTNFYNCTGTDGCVVGNIDVYQGGLKGSQLDYNPYGTSWGSNFGTCFRADMIPRETSSLKTRPPAGPPRSCASRSFPPVPKRLPSS